MPPPRDYGKDRRVLRYRRHGMTIPEIREALGGISRTMVYLRLRRAEAEERKQGRAIAR